MYLRTVPTATGDSTKLQSKYRGPLVVFKKLPGDTYGITDLQHDKEGRRYASTAHVSQLKLWQPVENEGNYEDASSDDETAFQVTENPMSTCPTNEPEECKQSTKKDQGSTVKKASNAAAPTRERRAKKIPQHLQDFVLTKN